MKRLSFLFALAFGLSGALFSQALPDGYGTEQPPRALDLRVASYNVGLLRALGSDHVPLVRQRAKASGPAIAAYADAEKPDILLLQEVWTAAQAKPIEAALAERGYAAHRPKVSSIIGLNSGLILFLKAPLKMEEWGFKTFKKTTFIDGMARKGILRAVLRGPGGLRFALLGTHTIAVDTVEGLAEEGSQLKAMMAQMEELAAAAADLSEGGSLPLLLMGDFNAGPGYVEQAYRLLADGGSLQDSFVRGGGSGLLATWDRENPLVKHGNYPLEPSARIDLVFLGDGTQMAWRVRAESMRRVMTEPLEALSLSPTKGVEALPLPLSDHYGYQADLILELVGQPGEESAPSPARAGLEAIQGFRAEADRLVFTVWNKGYTGKASFRLQIGEGTVGWNVSLIRVAPDEGKMMPQALELSWGFEELGLKPGSPESFSCANPFEGFLW